MKHEPFVRAASAMSELHPHPSAPARDPDQCSPRPPLLIRKRDEQRLQEYAIGSMLSAPRIAGGLLDELARADVRPDSEVPPDVVGLGSTVMCFETDGQDSAYHWGQLVGPDEAKAGAPFISVVSDLGAALIGLAAGQCIVWNDRRGRVRQVTVLEVDTPT